MKLYQVGAIGAIIGTGVFYLCFMALYDLIGGEKAITLSVLIGCYSSYISHIFLPKPEKKKENSKERKR